MQSKSVNKLPLKIEVAYVNTLLLLPVRPVYWSQGYTDSYGSKLKNGMTLLMSTIPHFHLSAQCHFIIVKADHCFMVDGALT